MIIKIYIREKKQKQTRCEPTDFVEKTVLFCNVMFMKKKSQTFSFVIYLVMLEIVKDD